MGTRLALIHCDSLFLPGSVGVGVGKEDHRKDPGALEQIVANKVAALILDCWDATVLLPALSWLAKSDVELQSTFSVHV